MSIKNQHLPKIVRQEDRNYHKPDLKQDQNTFDHQTSTKGLAAETGCSLIEAVPTKFPTDFFISPAKDIQIEQQSLLYIVQNYLRYYASGDSHTARAKRYDLEYFVKFLAFPAKSSSAVLLSDWTMQQTQNFIENRLEIGEAPSTVSRRLATLKHLGRTLADRFAGFINPAREVKSPKYELAKPQGLSLSELEILRVAIQLDLKQHKDSYEKKRNSIVFEILAQTGLRADEIRLLKRGKLSKDLSWFKQVRTKGRKFRDVYVPEGLRFLLEDYLELSRLKLVGMSSELKTWNSSQWDELPLLISTHRATEADPLSFGLSAKTLWRIISGFGEILRANNVDIHLHPHKLRHTFAHGLLDSSKDIRLVAQALGHSDVRTTMRYTERDKEELAKSIELSQQAVGIIKE